MYSSFRGILALLAPVQRYLQSSVNRAAPKPAGASDHQAVSRQHPAASQAPMPARRALRPPVRVVRIIEGSQTHRYHGRLMISGRMADVCAELDRMVEREAALRATA